MPTQYIDKINLPGNKEIELRDSISEMKDVALASLVSGQVLSYNGTNWENSDIDIGLPDQTGNSGKLLTTDGTSMSWIDKRHVPTNQIKGIGFVSSNPKCIYVSRDVSFWSNGDSDYSSYFILICGADVTWNTSELSNRTFYRIDGTDTGNWTGYRWDNYTSISKGIYSARLSDGSLMLYKIGDYPNQTNHEGEFLTTNGTSVSWAPAPSAITESDVLGWGFTKNTGTLTGVTFNGASATIDGSIARITATIPSTARDVQALPDTTKYAASHSLTIDPSTYVMTSQLKDQDGNDIGASQSVDLPLETMVVGGSYNDSTRKIELSLKNGNTIDFSVADLVSGLQTEITSSNKLSADLVSDGTTNKVYTSAEKTKLSSIASGAEVNVKPDWNAASGSSTEILNKPTIPTESTVSGWGFTKNTGTLTGVTFNGTHATVSNGIASISAKTLPTVASSDNGKIMQVVNGAWSLVTPVTIYSGASAPNNSQGIDGDIYIQQ